MLVEFLCGRIDGRPRILSHSLYTTTGVEQGEGIGARNDSRSSLDYRKLSTIDCAKADRQK